MTPLLPLHNWQPNWDFGTRHRDCRKQQNDSRAPNGKSFSLQENDNLVIIKSGLWRVKAWSVYNLSLTRPIGIPVSNRHSWHSKGMQVDTRMKKLRAKKVEAVALQLKPLCKRRAILILDDHVELARKLGSGRCASGQKDMPIDEARQLENHLSSVVRQIHSKTSYNIIVPEQIISASVLSGSLLQKKKKNLSPCSGAGRLYRYFIPDEGGAYRTPGSSYRRNHL